MACDVLQRDDRAIVIVGDGEQQLVSVVDRGNGNVTVECQEPGLDLPVKFLEFESATGIIANLAAGDDALEFVSHSLGRLARTIDFKGDMGPGDDTATVVAKLVTNGASLKSTESTSIAIDGGGGENTLKSFIQIEEGIHGKFEMRNWADTELNVSGLVDLTASMSSSDQGIDAEYDNGFVLFVPDSTNSSATLDIVGADGRDEVRVEVSENRLDSLEIKIDTKNGDSSAASDDVYVDGRIITAENYDSARFDLFVVGAENLDLSLDAASAHQDSGPPISFSTYTFQGLPGSSAQASQTQFSFLRERVRAASDNRVSISSVGFNEVTATAITGSGDDVLDVALLIPGFQRAPESSASINVDLGNGSNALTLNVEGYDYTAADILTSGNDKIAVDARVPGLFDGGTWQLDFNGNRRSDAATASFVADLSSGGEGGAHRGVRLFVKDVTGDLVEPVKDNVHLRLTDAPAEPEPGGIFEVIVTVQPDYEFNLEGSIRPGKTTVLADRGGVDIDHVGKDPDLHLLATGAPEVDLSVNSDDSSYEFRNTWPSSSPFLPYFEVGITPSSATNSDEPGLSGVTIYAHLNGNVESADDGPNIYLNLEDIRNAGPERSGISLISGPTRASLTLEHLELSGRSEVNVGEFKNFDRHIGGMRIREGGSYGETSIAHRNILIISEDGVSDALEIDTGGSFTSQVTGGPERNRVVNRLENVINRGEYRQSINTGGGRDVVVRSIDGFQNYETAVFDTGLGAGADLYLGWDRIYVATGARFDTEVRGNEGRDRIFANIAAEVDGAYRFEASGGRGSDTISLVHKLRTRSPDREDHTPAIDILVAGGRGHDRLASWLFAPGVPEELIHALIDGGHGIDRYRGNVDAVNCES